MSLYESLQEKLSGHPYSGYFTANCPYHNETHPSFFVYEDGWFKCASCGKKGTLETLNRFLGGKDVKVHQSHQLLPQWGKWERQYGDLTEIARVAHNNLKKFPSMGFYFRKRQIDQFIEQGHFGYLDGWCLFPVLSPDRKIENIVVRATKGDTRYVIKRLDEKKPPLYCPNWDRVKYRDTVYVVYGIVDSWAFEAIEKPCITGITGKSLSADLLKPLGKKFIIVPDEYEEDAARQLANSLDWRATVKQLVFPDGTKDPDNIRTRFGNDYFAQMIGATA